MKHNGIIDNFHGDNRWLSNFWIHDEVHGLSVEHHYQAAKADNYDDFILIMEAETPAQAKKLGKTIRVRGDWEQVKLIVMEQCIRDKFTYNSELRKKLLETRGMMLVEGNWWGDRFWGVCEGEGENHLGKILMKLRDDFLRYE